MEYFINLFLKRITADPEIEDDDLADMVMQEGATERLAWQIVIFLPMAFCRALFPDVGFQSSFILEHPENRNRANLSLHSSKVFRACLQAACSFAGKNPEVSEWVAARAAEYSVIEGYLDKGSNLSNIILSEVVIQESDNLFEDLSQNSPGSTSSLSEEERESDLPKRGWWRFWR